MLLTRKKFPRRDGSFSCSSFQFHERAYSKSLPSTPPTLLMESSTGSRPLSQCPVTPFDDARDIAKSPTMNQSICHLCVE